MKTSSHFQKRIINIAVFLLLTIMPQGITMGQQAFSFGIHADPAICWFSTNIKEISNDGARPGFSFGLSFNKFFTPNYSFSTGINLIRAGGRVVSKDTMVLKLTNSTKVLPGNSVIYKIQYLSIPIGLKLQTNQIGYLTFFTDIGLDPKVVIGGKADIPYLNISGEDVSDKFRDFNLSYHIRAGIEYSLGGNTAVVLGLDFDNNFLDLTRDAGVLHPDKITHKLLSFRIGVNF